MTKKIYGIVKDDEIVIMGNKRSMDRIKNSSGDDGIEVRELEHHPRKVKVKDGKNG